MNCYTENDVPVIGIGDDPYAPERYVIISQFIDEDESIDDSIGLECFFFNGVIYNAVKKITLDKDILFIKIKDNKIGKIGADKININLSIKDEDFDKLLKYVMHIFEKSTTLIELTN